MPNSGKSFTKIPVIDISSLGGPDPEAGRVVAEALGQAARDVGFFYVSGHGISESDIAALRQAASGYFAQPMAEKMRHYIGASASHKGFVPKGEEIYGTGKPDHKEAFDIGFEVPADHPLVQAGTPLLGLNDWPELPGFRAAVQRYYAQVFALGRRLFRGLSMALGLPEQHFESMVTYPPSKLRLIHYPVNPEPEDSLGIGAHTDYECFTILLPDSPGLEVLNPEGQWIDAPPIPGSFVVNIGDMLEVMTAGRFVATAHRVRRVQQERFSFPLFFAVDYHTRIRPLTAFDDGSQFYEEVSIGEHMWGQALQTYRYLRARVAQGAVALPPGARKPASFAAFKRAEADTNGHKE